MSRVFLWGAMLVGALLISGCAGSSLSDAEQKSLAAAASAQAELEQALAKKFRSEYLKNPKVTVTIATLEPYYMMGEVQKPGQFPYQSGLNVLTALAIAGGPTYRANRTTVQI